MQPFVFVVTGKGFLYHQVRCMMAILFSIGRRQEDVSVIKALCDPNEHPEKPTYKMAPEAPLVLWSCRFASISFPKGSPGDHQKLLKHMYSAMQGSWMKSIVSMAMYDGLLSSFFPHCGDQPGGQEGGISERYDACLKYSATRNSYTPFRSRKTKHPR